MSENEPKFNQSLEEESEDDFSLESHIMTKEEIEKRTEILEEKIEDSPDLKFTKEFYKEFKKHEQNPRLYLVGGAVRDGLLKRDTENFDFLATGLNKEELGQFLGKHGKVIETEKEDFPIFKFIPEGSELKVPIDVALPRKEKWIPHKGYQDVEMKTSPELSLEDDVGRRDFTINAIAYDFKENKLIDIHNGVEDLKKGIIRAVDKPGERFDEDPSRILRAIRFSSQLDFKIEKNTSEAMKEKRDEINKLYDDKGVEKSRVSREIIAKEFLKSFDADPAGTLELYDKYGILNLGVEKEREQDKILPEVDAMKNTRQPKNFHSEGDVWEHTKLALKNLPPDASIDLKLAALFHDVGKPPTYSKKPGDRIRFNEHDKKGAEITRRICNRLRFSATGEIKVNVDKIVWLVENHMICLSDKVENMRERTIEKYFFREDKWGDDLLKLSYVDISATVPPSEKSDFTNYNKLKKRIEDIRTKAASPEVKKKLVPELLNGDDIIEITNITPGPLVGDIKNALRELQLGGKIKEREEAEELVPKLKEIFEKLFDYSFENLEKLEDKEKRVDKALKHITHNT